MNTSIEQFKTLKTEIERNRRSLDETTTNIKINYLDKQPGTRTLIFHNYPQQLFVLGAMNTHILTAPIPNYLQPFLEQAIADNILALLNGAEALADEERKRLARKAAQEYAELLCESDE
jgi:hypothetical protein